MIVTSVENFESYLREGQLITTIIVLENKCQGEFQGYVKFSFKWLLRIGVFSHKQLIQSIDNQLMKL